MKTMKKRKKKRIVASKCVLLRRLLQSEKDFAAGGEFAMPSPWSRTRAEAVAKSGAVTVDGMVVTKPSQTVGEGQIVEVDCAAARAALRARDLEEARELLGKLVFEDDDVLVVECGNAVSELGLVNKHLPTLYGAHATRGFSALVRKYRACSGLFAIAKTREAASRITAKETVRAIVHGEVSGPFCIRPEKRATVATQVCPVKVVRCNKSGWLSLVDVTFTPCGIRGGGTCGGHGDGRSSSSSSSGGGGSGGEASVRPFRHQARLDLKRVSRPVLGSGTHAQSLKGGRSRAVYMHRATLVLQRGGGGGGGGSGGNGKSPSLQSFESPLPAAFAIIMEREAAAAAARDKDQAARFGDQEGRDKEYEGVSGSDVLLPHAYRAGKCAFMGMVFGVSPAVLIPRESSAAVVLAAEEAISRARDENTGDLLVSALSDAATATAVAAAASASAPAAAAAAAAAEAGSVAASMISGKGKTAHILDLGTGSGCLLLALLSKLRAAGQDARGVGIDVSDAALEVASRNAKELGFDPPAAVFCRGTFAGGCQEISWPCFDAIVCNPPYRSKRTAARRLNRETIEHEPEIAWSTGTEDTRGKGGEDELKCYREVLAAVGFGATGQGNGPRPRPWRLRSGGGVLCFEAPPDLAPKVREMMAERGFLNIYTRSDARGMERAVVGVALAMVGV